VLSALLISLSLAVLMNHHHYIPIFVLSLITTAR
jgi:hypothetical protein